MLLRASRPLPMQMGLSQCPPAMSPISVWPMLAHPIRLSRMNVAPTTTCMYSDVCLSHLCSLPDVTGMTLFTVEAPVSCLRNKWIKEAVELHTPCCWKDQNWCSGFWTSRRCSPDLRAPRKPLAGPGLRDPPAPVGEEQEMNHAWLLLPP